MARKGRSPRYPRINLEEAIGRVRRVYQAEHTHKADKEVIARDLGYGSLNGASVSLIGALKNYGLLREDRDGVRVTEDAITIIVAPEGGPERIEALRRAAFAPRVFADLREAYGDDLAGLPGDTNLRYYLVKKGFLERAANEAVHTYRDNLELVSEEAAKHTAAEEQAGEQPVEAPRAEVPGAFSAVAVEAQDHFTEFLQIPVSKDCKARLSVDGPVTREAVDRLIAYLELSKDDLPSKDQLEDGR